jgi:hypothetical protein
MFKIQIFQTNYLWQTGHPHTMKILNPPNPPLSKGGWGDLKTIFYINSFEFLYSNFGFVSNFDIRISNLKMNTGRGRSQHLWSPPRGKVAEGISKMRMIPKGMEALSPAPKFHLIYAK